MTAVDGGYDEGYRRCSCFWGKTPGSLVKKLVRSLGTVSNLRVLDAGCGEGKNAIYLAKKGASVLAMDISEAPLKNAARVWPALPNVNWYIADIRKDVLKCLMFDIVLLYGILHCLMSAQEIKDVIERLQKMTVQGGYHLVCAFNNRKQNLSAHPRFTPTLLSHVEYLDFYKGWEISEESNMDLWEIHPHNNILHMHSMTRFIANKKVQ